MYQYTREELADFTHAELIDLYKVERKRTGKGNLIILKLIAAKSTECTLDPYGALNEYNERRAISAKSKAAMPDERRAEYNATVKPWSSAEGQRPYPGFADAYYESRQHFVLSSNCTKCGATPGNPCKYPSGVNALTSHLARRKQGRLLHHEYEKKHGPIYSAPSATSTPEQTRKEAEVG